MKLIKANKCLINRSYTEPNYVIGLDLAWTGNQKQSNPHKHLCQLNQIQRLINLDWVQLSLIEFN